MASGTRGAKAAAAARATELEQQLLLLSGKANRSERNRINRELWALREGTASPASPVPSCSVLSSDASSDSPYYTANQQLTAHWRAIHEHTNPHLMGLCVRCGDGSNPTCCRFHPDAKAFAFGTGRFDYGYSNAWDTPHDRWFCCGAVAAQSAGCCEEPMHTIDPNWWQAYVVHAPPLEDSEDDGDEEDGDSEDESVEFVTDALETARGIAAMDLS
jgi:hypothetical protein